MADPTAARKELRAHALKHPGAWEDHPWEEDVAKVGEKIFVVFGRAGPDLFVGVKLPRSLLFARTQKFVAKFGYGMDKSGWVATRFAKNDQVPVELLRGWIDESYEAIAPGPAARRAPRPATARARPKATTARKRLAAQRAR